MSLLRDLALALRFVLELAAIVAIGWGASHSTRRLWSGWSLG